MGCLVCTYFILLTLVTASFVRSIDGLTLADIYQISKDALECGNVQKNMDVVIKHYLTHEKENSIWYVGQQEAYKLLKLKVSIDDLKFQEKLIAAVEVHYKECLNMEVGAHRAQCFYHLASPVLDLERGSRWIAAPELSIMNKVKFGTLYNIAGTLIAHLSIIAKENFKQFKEKPLIDIKIHGYAKVLQTIIRMMNEFANTIIHWRMDAISAPIVCEMHERFWKEFPGICETRWRRSIDNEEKLPVPALPEDEFRNNSDNDSDIGDNRSYSGDTDEFDVVSLEDQFKTHEQDPLLYIADKIGNTCEIGPKRCKKFRVQVIDDVKQEVVFQDYKYVDYTARGEAMTALSKRAHVARGEAVRQIEEEITKFANSTYVLNNDLIIATMNSLVEETM